MRVASLRPAHMVLQTGIVAVVFLIFEGVRCLHVTLDDIDMGDSFTRLPAHQEILLLFRLLGL